MRSPFFVTPLLAASIFAAAATAQSPGSSSGAAFDVAAIKVNPPEPGFHFAADSLNGGPGTSDPGLFRCSRCTLATLLSEAFGLRNYQFPARTSLTANTFEVTARIPEGATREQFRGMLQNLLKERFGLSYHYTEKKMRGYQLVLAKTGSKLRESSELPHTPTADNAGQHQFGHNGLVIFAGSARFRGDRQTSSDIAKLLSDQLSLPVEDQTGLSGKYDVSLTWSGAVAHSSDHGDGPWGGPGHQDHGGAAGAPPADGNQASGPSLFDAVQDQLGLRLVQAEQSTARIFLIDHVEALPTGN